MRKNLKKGKSIAAATCLLVVTLLIAGIPAGSRDVLATNTNYALNGTVTSSNTNASLAASYPVANLTDGISASNEQGDENAIINYLDNGLGYYEIAMKSVATLNQVRIYFSNYEPEKRPKDMAVDLKKSDGTWVRAAEMQNIDYGTDLTVVDGAKYLAFDFQPVNDVAVIRVTANKLRNGSTNFRLMEVEAYNDETITTYTNYAIPVVEEDADDTQSENLVLGKTPTTPSGRGVGNIGRITDGNTGYEGSTNAYVLYGAANSNNHESNETYYQFDFEAATMLNSVKVYLYNGETDRRPQDIAVDVKLANGTWKRVATRYAIVYSGANAESITVDANRDGKPESSCLEFSFEEEECVAFRLTANRQRVRATNASYTNSTLNWMLTEIEAYHDSTITEYTGIETESNEAYEILMPESDLDNDSDTDTGGDTGSDSDGTDSPTTSTMKNYALNGNVTSSNTNASLEAGYPAAQATDGVTPYTRPADQTSVINYQDNGLAYYQVALTEKAKINQVRVYFNMAESEKRPKDIAVDVQTENGKWLRVAEMHNINYDEALVVTDNPRYLAFNFEVVDNVKNIRVTANQARNGSTNFRIMEIEAYLDASITKYTGTKQDSNASYNIPEVGKETSAGTNAGGTSGSTSGGTSGGKNYALNGKVTSSNTNASLEAGYPASQATDGVTPYTRPADQTSVINYQANGLAYYEVELSQRAKINQVRVYFNMAEPEKRPKDIAVDIKKADGTWVRAAEMHNIDYDKALVVTDNPRYLAFNFEALEATTIRVTANRTRNQSDATNFRIMEIEAYLDTTITAYTGVKQDENEAYNIPLLSADAAIKEETDTTVKEEEQGGDDETVFESDENVNTTVTDTKDDHTQLIQTTGALIGTTLLVSIIGIAAYLIWSKKQDKKTLEGKMNRSMKKIITACFLVGVLLMAAPTTSEAQTDSSQWQRQTGGAEVEFTEQGVSLECTSGLNVWEYTENTVDLTDFSVTFSVGQEAWYGGAENGMYQTIILKNKQEWGGSYGLFLLLMPSESGSLRVEGQILNKGYLLSPSYATFDVDVTKPITLRGKLVDDSHYRITVDGDEENAYAFEIPINYQFHTELDGQGWFCFGVCSTKEDKVEMKVESVNGLDLTGTASNTGATDSSDDSGDTEDEILKPDGTVGSSSELTVNTGNSQSSLFSGTMDDTLYLTLVICLCVMELIIVGGVIFFFAYVRKKVKKINSMVE